MAMGRDADPANRALSWQFTPRILRLRSHSHAHTLSKAPGYAAPRAPAARRITLPNHAIARAVRTTVLADAFILPPITLAVAKHHG